MVKTIQIKKAGEFVTTEEWIPMAAYISNHMREADKRECDPQNVSPLEAIAESLLASEEAHIAYGHVPICIYGVADTPEGYCIWALASEDINSYHKALVKIGMGYIREKVNEYGMIYNYISLENKKALNYIRHAGAIFKEKIMIGNTEFIKFEIRR